MNSTPDPRIPPVYQQPTNQDPPYGEQPYGGDNSTVRSSNVGNAYAQSQHQNYVDPLGNRVENRVEVFEDENQRRANARYWTTTITYFILGVLEIILLLRLFFRLFGANQGNSFILFLYGVSHVFVAPFNGIFNDQTLGSNGVFETSTLIAMLVYALLAWGIVSLGRVLFASIRSSRQSVTTTRRDHSL